MKTRKKSFLPVYCKYCGSRMKRDRIGLLCKTRNCQWENGLTGSEAKLEMEERNEA